MSVVARPPSKLQYLPPAPLTAAAGTATRRLGLPSRSTTASSSRRSTATLASTSRLRYSPPFLPNLAHMKSFSNDFECV